MREPGVRHGTSLPCNLTITDMGKITIWECTTPGPIKIAADNPTIWRKAGKGVALVGIVLEADGLVVAVGGLGL